MKKIKIFSILNLTIISSILPFCVSCSDNAKGKMQIIGGSAHLAGGSIGKDTNVWKMMDNKTNYSDTAKWKIEPSFFGVYIEYNPLEKGMVLSWSNLSAGEYKFTIKATISTWDEENTFCSPIITLQIYGDSPVQGGSTNLNHQYSTGNDNHAWTIIYNGIDFSKDAIWSIDNTIPTTSNIKIEYDANKNGAIVSWDKLEMKIYTFRVKCIIKPQTLKESLTFYSDDIQLNVSRYDFITISGGTHYINAKCNQSGEDNNLLYCHLNDNIDVSPDTSFSIVWDDNWQKTDIYISATEKRYKYICWKNTFTEPETVKFKILAKYDKFETKSVDYYVINFV